MSSDRTGSCSLLMKLLKENPKPVCLDFSYLNIKKSSAVKRKSQTLYESIKENYLTDPGEGGLNLFIVVFLLFIKFYFKI